MARPRREQDYTALYVRIPTAEAEKLECDTKTVDNALQRVKRKVGAHLSSREVLL